ncbi:MAG: glycosyltransferase family 2 protein [Candidatus Nanopelagicaceae bacterium]|nr:glycosyltransferase family 2 protein [Candidatus Nanopelagicaceae bacterium]
MPNQTLELLLMMTSNDIELTIGYSTLSERVKQIRFPKQESNRELLVVVQNPDQANLKVEQGQAKVFELTNRGVAKSRNAVLDKASGEFLIFGDDDIVFNESGIKELISYFRSHPQCDIIMAQAVDETGSLRKHYPRQAHKLTRFNSAKAATYEMMIRVAPIREKKIRFDESFGAGAEKYLGDEYIFITDALKAGLQGVFLPIPVAIHPKESSGSGWGTRRDLTARAAVFSRVFGPFAPIARAMFLVKSRKTSVGLRNGIRFIIGK